MNRQDDTPIDDADLTPYLEGRDGVSTAYRASSTEMPPVALDAAILQAARASTGAAKQPKMPALRNYYSLAASLMLGMMLGAVLFEDDGDVPLATTASAPEAAVELQKTVSVPEQTQPDANAADFAQPAIQPEALAAESAAAGAAAESSDTAAPAQAASAFRERTLPTPLPPIVTRNVITTAISPARNEETAAAQVATTLEEISITGSRVRRLDYRDNQQDWLREMARMSEQLDESTEELTTLRETLELERAEFTAEYPDVRLDEALRQLRGQ